MPVAEQVGAPAPGHEPVPRSDGLLSLAAFVAVLTVIVLMAVVVPVPVPALPTQYFDILHLLRPELLGWHLFGCWVIYAAAAVALAQLRLDSGSWLGRTATGRRLFLPLASAALGGALLVDAASVLPDRWAQVTLRTALWLSAGLFPLILVRRADRGRGLPLALALALPGTMVVAVAVVVGRLVSAPIEALMVPIAGMILATLAGLVAMPPMLVQGEVGDLDGWIERAERLWRWADAPVKVLVLTLAKLAIIVVLIVLQPTDAAARGFDAAPDVLARSLGMAVFIVGILLLDRRLGLELRDLARAGVGAAGVIAWALGAYGVVAAFVVLGGPVSRHPGAIPGLVVVGLVSSWLERRRPRRRVALLSATTGALAGGALATFLPGAGGDPQNLGGALVIWLLGAGALVGVIMFVVRTVRARDRAMGVVIAAVAAWVGVRSLLMPAVPSTGWLNVDAWITVMLCVVAVLLVRGRPWSLIDGREIVLTVVVLTAIVDVPLVGGWWVAEPVGTVLAIAAVVTPGLLVVRRTLWSLLTGTPAKRSGGALLTYTALAAFCLLVGGGALRLVVQLLDLALEFLALPIAMLLIAAAPAHPPGPSCR